MSRSLLNLLQLKTADAYCIARIAHSLQILCGPRICCMLLVLCHALSDGFVMPCWTVPCGRNLAQLRGGAGCRRNAMSGMIVRGANGSPNELASVTIRSCGRQLCKQLMQAASEEWEKEHIMYRSTSRSSSSSRNSSSGSGSGSEFKIYW